MKKAYVIFMFGVFCFCNLSNGFATQWTTSSTSSCSSYTMKIAKKGTVLSLIRDNDIKIDEDLKSGHL